MATIVATMQTATINLRNCSNSNSTVSIVWMSPNNYFINRAFSPVGFTQPMKRLFLILTGACLLGAVGLRSAEPPPPIQLKGIVSFSSNRFALLENTQARPFQRELILKEGQRDESVEVLEIDV